jgi:CRISPR-associated endonuclease/helicase Cas3
MTEDQFRTTFADLTGNERGHFPWQWALYQEFEAGRFPPSCDLPTGLGKTSVIALWLIASAHSPRPVPRRLVYVVDRRAVVGQATEVAKRLREQVDRDDAFKRALGLEKRSLPISTLRGQHVDNKEWLEDPASPAIIVGTVDMIGSRLLFSGYGLRPTPGAAGRPRASRKRRRSCQPPRASFARL